MSTRPNRGASSGPYGGLQEEKNLPQDSQTT